MRPHGAAPSVARMDAHQNRWFLDPIVGRGYPEDGARAWGWRREEVLEGDDWFHNGAFRQQMMPYMHDQTATRGGSVTWWTSPYDDYDTYMSAGSAGKPREDTKPGFRPPLHGDDN